MRSLDCFDARSQRELLSYKDTLRELIAGETFIVELLEFGVEAHGSIFWSPHRTILEIDDYFPLEGAPGYVTQLISYARDQYDFVTDTEEAAEKLLKEKIEAFRDRVSLAKATWEVIAERCAAQGDAYEYSI